MRQNVALLSQQRIAHQQDVRIKLFPEAFILHPSEEVRITSDARKRCSFLPVEKNPKKVFKRSDLLLAELVSMH